MLVSYWWQVGLPVTCLDDVSFVDFMFLIVLILVLWLYPVIYGRSEFSLCISLTSVDWCPQGNGKEEVVCCSWSGHTYIVNHSKETVRYDFPDSVAAFSAGLVGNAWIYNIEFYV